MRGDRPIDSYLWARWCGPEISSYAQNAEDVRLWRVFGDTARGFYVDVGAGDPTLDSVTRLFYDAGWTGINIEPGPNIDRLRLQRPRDTNLELAIATQRGEASMLVSSPEPGLSSLRAPPVPLPEGISLETKRVRTARLEDVLRKYAPQRPIDFLKIDVEGLERDVLESFDLLEIRPKVVVMEAIAPLEFHPSHEDWETLVTEAGYVFAAFDGINRFYVATEHADLTPALAYPISPLDRFVARQARAGQSGIDSGHDLWTSSSEIAMLEAAVRERGAALEAMEATLSWRVTRPLRALRRARPVRARMQDDSRGARASSNTVRTETACAERLNMCSALLRASRGDTGYEVRTTLNEALALFEEAVASTSTSSARSAWLGLVCATGSYPVSEDADEAARVLRSDGPAGLAALVASSFQLAQETGAASDMGLEIVTGDVVVDVSQVASSALHTGIQRVAREVVTRWVRDHPGTLLAFFDDSHHVYRLLEREERDRLLGWREHLDTSADRGSDRSLRLSERALVPWRCRLVCPEVPGTSRSHALRSLTAAGIQDSLTLIGYDLIPIIAADVVPKGVPESFTHYLSVVRRADRVSAISRQSAQSFRAFATTLDTMGISGPEVEAQPLPSVVPAVTDDVIESARKTLGVGELPLVLVVGSFEPRKNHLRVLEAAERLWRAGERFELLFIAGADWMSGRPALGRYLQTLRSRSRPIVVRERASEKHLWAAYKLARFTVFPSLVEGYGLPVAESLASGTPVITSRHGSMAEIAEGGGALLVDPRLVDDLEEKMRQLLVDADLLERLRSEALARDLGSWDDYARDVWRFLVGDDASGRSGDS